MRIRSFIGIFVSVGLIGCGGSDAVKEVVEQAYPDGSKKKVSYYKGKHIVRTAFFFEDGKLKSDQYFKLGQPDSCQIIYNQDGSKYSENGSRPARDGPDRNGMKRSGEE